MKIIPENFPGLISPDEFTIITTEDTISDLIKIINSELIRLCNSEQLSGLDPIVEVYLGDDFDEKVTDEMVEAIRELYQAIGWGDISYKHEDETSESYENHIFIFHFDMTKNKHGIQI